MRSYKCNGCERILFEGGYAWDWAREHGKCLSCNAAIRDFPVDVKNKQVRALISRREDLDNNDINRVPHNTRRFGLMTIAILMATVSLLGGGKGSPYTLFWIYAAHLSFRGDIKTLKIWLVVLIWINLIVAAGVLIVVDSGSRWVMPGVDSASEFAVLVGISLAVKIVVLLRINVLMSDEKELDENNATTNNGNIINSKDEKLERSNQQSSGRQETMEEAYAKNAPASFSFIVANIAQPNTELNISAEMSSGRKESNTFPSTPAATRSTEPSLMDWEFALEEYEGEQRNNGLWAKIYAEHGGNENATKAQYLKLRAYEINLSKE